MLCKSAHNLFNGLVESGEHPGETLAVWIKVSVWSNVTLRSLDRAVH